MDNNKSTPIKGKRLESLDALRGFDMLFIMGGSSQLVALAAPFPESSFWQFVEQQMHHVKWEGLAHHDTIFPLFLFIAGISFPFSLDKQRLNGRTSQQIYWKIIKRGLILVLLGLIYNNMLKFEFATLRFPSVLARIGLGWMFGALIYCQVKSWKARLITIMAILVGYWLIMALIPAPDAPAGVGVFSKEGSIACYLDRIILGAHAYRPEYDPEGIFSTVPAIGTALMGMTAGDWVKREDISGNKKVLGLALAGIILAALGWIWNFAFPINKALWSSSFACAVAGYSFLMFALFYYIIDVKGWRKWAKFFVVIGLNSITIYLAQRFIPLWDTQHRIFDGFINLFPDSLHQLMVEITYIATCWGLLYFLYRHRIFLKV